MYMLLQSRIALIYGLQSRARIRTKLESFFVLQNGASGTKTKGKYYKKEQLLLQGETSTAK